MTEIRNALFIILGLSIIGNLLFSDTMSFVCAVIGVGALMANLFLLFYSAIKGKNPST